MTSLSDLTDVLTGARRRDARQAEEFADLLESGRTRPASELAPLVRLARALSPAAHLPEPAFRTALRTQLVAEAGARVPSRPAERPREQARPSAPRWRHVVAALAVTSAVTGVGAAAASSQAVPGDTLYGLKLRVEAIQLSLADSDLERGRELLEQAEARLGEAEQLRAAGATGSTGSTGSMSPAGRDQLATTLTAMDQAGTAGAAALVESYDETGDPESMLLLARFVDRQQVRLRALSIGLDPELRASAQRAIDSLAEVESATRALLSPTSRERSEASSLPGLARADDWASSRGALPPGAATVSEGRTDSTSARQGAGRSGPSTLPGPSGLSADATRSGAAGAASLPSVSPLPAVTTGTGPLPEPSVPVPSVAATPLPSVSPTVPGPTVVPAPSTSTGPVPVTTCVAVPPLTTC